MIRKNQKAYVVPVNVDVLTKMEEDPDLKSIVQKADLVLTDSQILVWVSKFLRKPVKEKISGSDLVPKLCKVSAKKGYTLYFLGAGKGVGKQAASRMRKRYPNIRIAGTYSPPMGFEKNQEEVDHINQLITAAHPDILIVSFGCPKQEKWIAENYKKYDAKVSICAGATLDFLSGNVKRAPKWMSQAGLEWFYRFLQEPKRLFKRYFLDGFYLLKLLWKYR